MRKSLNYCAVALAALTLLGCAAEAPGAHHPLPTPTSIESPTAEPVSAPVSRIPLTCDELVPVADAAEFLGVNPSELERSSSRDGEFATAVLQGGAIGCSWSGPAIGEDNSIGMTLEILADAAALFAQHNSYPQPQSVVDSLGPGSVITRGEDAFHCSMVFLIDGYWVELEASSKLAGQSRISDQQFGEAIATRLRAAGPLRPAFSPPPGALGVDSSCTKIDDEGAFRSALNSPELRAPTGDEPFSGLLVSAISAKAGRLVCLWGTDSGAPPSGDVVQVSLSLTPGGSWNFEAVAAEDAAHYDAQPIDVDGATRAVAYSTSDSCWLVADVHESLVYVIVIDGTVPGGGPCVTAASIVQLAIAAA